MGEHHDAELNFAERMGYGDYLALDRVLDAQHPLSDAHDELLFIIQHQTSELWMKLAVHELESARDAILADRLPQAFKLLARVARILEQLNGAWDVLRTMTPSDYTSFRDALGQSSGFQSWQYRAVEYLCGNRVAATLGPHRHRAPTLARLEAILAAPSIYDAALTRLHAAGLLADPARDWRAPHVASEAVVAAWEQVYRVPETRWPLYELAEKLVDLEDYFRRWRFNHVTTVERVIGLKRGTGGTAGASYLRKMLEVELFPELWQVRTRL
ncbi:tryptophan 2,3-dioxygenase [Sphingomonas sp. RHCKR7]|uniref:tryptophan 2,3-dioxygenase n=1 Tax=Sphingomonas folli TaxID=2862497 RepID=UPI001CA4B27E|nr:tryptophan 2,3-dioxygenase family protein [Sphingomonas folli]MBW6526672.1 tryptophan 2,3-dioxygenase [Sphingomonas folli]